MGAGIAWSVAMAVSTACAPDAARTSLTEASDSRDRELAAAPVSRATAADTTTSTRSAAVLHLGPVRRVADEGWLGDVVTGADGTVHAVWGSALGPRIREAAEGQPWRKAQAVYRDRPNWYTGPAGTTVGVGGKGAVTVAWVQENFTGWHAYRLNVSTRPTGGAWSRPVTLAKGHFTDYSVSGAEVGVGHRGHAALIWYEEEPHEGWRAAYRTRHGAWTRPSTFPRTGFGCCLEVAVGTSGVATFLYTRAHVVTHGELSVVDHENLMLRQRTPTGWLPPVTLSSDVAPGGDIDIDEAAPDQFVVTWKARGNAIHSGRYSDGTWTEDADLVKDRGLPQVAELSVDATQDGAAFVWADHDPEVQEAGTLYAAYQDAGSETGPVAAVAQRAWLPHVAHDRLGASLVWTGPHRHVYMSHHDPGTPSDTWSAPVQLTEARTDDLGHLVMSASPSSATTTVLWDGAPRSALYARRVTASR